MKFNEIQNLKVIFTPVERRCNIMEIILQDLDPREALLKWFSCNSHIRPNGRGIYDIPVLSFKSGRYF